MIQLRIKNYELRNVFLFELRIRFVFFNLVERKGLRKGHEGIYV